MLVNRNAATVVGDGQPVAFFERDFDPVGVPGHRFVHRVVEHFGREMVQRAFVGAADIHAGPPTHRLQALEHLDGRAIVAVRRTVCWEFKKVIGHSRTIWPGGIRAQGNQEGEPT